MKKFFLLLVLFFGIVSYSQIINFPDANFKNALVNTNCVDTNNNGTGDADADTNNDGEIQESEGLVVIGLIISNQSISNLSGLEQFLNLQRLDCYGNPLVTLNLTNLTNLVILNCQNCQLTSLILDGLNNLATVYAGDNSFASIDLSTTGFIEGAFGPNINLEYLNIKNGFNSNCILLLNGSNTCTLFDNCPALSYVCLDESELPFFNEAPLLNPNMIFSTYCSFVPGGGYNIVTGNITYDCGNQNTYLNNVKVNITDGINFGSTYSNISGNYVLYPSIGNHTITPQMENPSYFLVSPTSVNYTFSTTGNTQTTNFCVTPNGIHPDLKITILPLTTARPGFNCNYKIIYSNVGNQIQSGSVLFNFDNSQFDFISSTPNTNSQNGNNLSWNFSNLNPFETREITFILNLNSPTETPAVNIGDVLHFSASLSTTETDETPSNNTFNFNQTVTGSFDPNDKTCLEGSQLSIADVSKPLHYLVRFQNTGTAAAENIVVKDILNSKLDWNSVKILSSSHTFRSTLLANKLEFFFENINLPASSIDEPASHGYIAFSVKPKSNVVVNDVITNSANIYFDYNYPITTNTTSTTVVSLANSTYNLDSIFTVYPNPTRTVLNIKMADNETLKKVEISNPIGQTILSWNATSTIDVSKLQSGTYFITVFSEKGKSTQKIIKL
jgi:uncharacterized repeat protein (TIGR01451 family)